MYWVFMVWYIVILILLLFNLFKSVKNKDNKHWITLLSTIIGAILSCILIMSYEFINTQSTYLDGIVVLLFTVLAGLIYGFISLLSIILKLFQKRRLKNKGIIKEKIEKKTKRRRLATPILYIALITICICFVDFLVYEHKEVVEKNRYDTVKKEKIEKMVYYINDKYDAEYTVEDNSFYREYKYDEVEMAPKKHNDFYIGTFDNGEESITVSVNKDNFLSDNAQIKDISYLIRDYYSDIVGIDIEYVVIKNKDGNYEDDLINNTLQFKFNDLITKDNIGEFIDELLNNNDVEMIFYVKDSNNRNDLLEVLIDKLSYLENMDNIQGLSIYLYNSKEELIIQENYIELYGDYLYDEVHLNYYAANMFGFVYVPNSIEFSEEFKEENTFVTIAFSNKKYAQGYKYEDKEVKTIKDWTIYDFK